LFPIFSVDKRFTSIKYKLDFARAAVYRSGSRTGPTPPNAIRDVVARFGEANLWVEKIEEFRYPRPLKGIFSRPPSWG
jgi:hypothetical protein